MSADEPEILRRGRQGRPAPQDACRAGGAGHPSSDPKAALGRGEEPHRPGRLARGGQHRRAMPPRGHCRLCRREGIAESLYYSWSKEFLEAGKRRLAGDTARAATTDEVKALRQEAHALKEVVAEQALELRMLKKTRSAKLAGRLAAPGRRDRPLDGAESGCAGFGHGVADRAA